MSSSNVKKSLAVCSGSVASRMPLVEVSGVCLNLIRFCGHKTRESLWEMRETQRLVSNVWALDSRLALAPFGIVARISVPVSHCLGAEVRAVVAAASCEQFIVCVPQCAALFFAKRGDHWVVAVHSDDADVATVGWKQPAAHYSQRYICHPITDAPTVVISMQWEVAVKGAVQNMATNNDTIAVGTNACMSLLNAHTGAVVTVTDTLNGAHVAFLDEERVVGVKYASGEWVIYEFTDNTLTKEVPIKAIFILSVKASANGKHLYLVDSGYGQVLVYSTTNWLPTACIPLRGYPLGKCDIASNGLFAQYFYYSKDDSYQMQLVESNTRCVTQTIRSKHRGEISQVAFSPNSHRIVATSKDPSVQLFDAITGQMIGEPRMAHTSYLNSVCFLSDDWFLTVSSDKSLVVWHCDSQPPIARIEDAHDETIICVLRLSTDSFATGDESGTVKQWKFECNDC